MSADQNLGTHLQTIDLIPMASVTATANGTGVDVQQFVGSIAVMLACKSTAGTTPTLDIKLQSSADNSTGWADISGAAFTQVTDAGTSAATLEKISVNVDACERYIRAVKTIGGTSSPAFMTTCVATGVKQVR
jgi:hypothetical protein